MIIALLILVIGLTPSLFSLWVMRQADARTQARLRLTLEAASARRFPGLALSPDHHYVEGLGYIIGDFNCRFNARSTYVRCAVNPFGPCDSCSHYQPKELSDESGEPL
ncbi:DUF6464 family protein [Oculatella sp. LEGE 06141]|uniref:DUF6464 family protein n=1 Tax=Oculatella sp. LEGE 06141 TaxID=1828648 RepID=UPI0030D7508B